MVNKDEVYGVFFHPAPSAASAYEIVTVGSKHLKYWSLDRDGIESKDKNARNASLTHKVPSTFEKTKITQKAFYSVSKSAAHLSPFGLAD
jgi:hypothetical protein